MPVSVVESKENSVVANVRVKRAGTRTQPCLMPLETGKGSDTNLFFSTMPAIIPTRRDLMMLTNLGGQPSLRSYGQQTLTTDCIKGLGRVHKEDVQVLILLAYFSWIFTSYGEDYVDCLSVSLEAAMLILGDDIIQLVVVIWFGMT